MKDILDILQFSKSTYMYWQRREAQPNRDEEIEKLILEIFQENKENYGYRRIDVELGKRGHIVNHKKVVRIMKKIGIKCISFTRKSRKYSSYRGVVGKIAKNLIHRRFGTSLARQKLTTDTSEFKYYESSKEGHVTIKKAYLDAYLDMFNGEIISFRVSKRPNAQAIMEALDEAITSTKDCPYRSTIHSDQGWAYQMKQYKNKLKDNRLFQSMSRKGNCLDNSPMENFFGILKQEMYHGSTFGSFHDLETAIKDYVYYYNHQRIKIKLGGLSPVDYRLSADHNLVRN